MGAYAAALLTLTTSGQLQNKPLSFSLLPYGIVGDGKPEINHNLDWNLTSSRSAWEKQKARERNTFPIYSVRCIFSISSDHNMQAEMEKLRLCMLCTSNGWIHVMLFNNKQVIFPWLISKLQCTFQQETLWPLHEKTVLEEDNFMSPISIFLLCININILILTSWYLFQILNDNQ